MECNVEEQHPLKQGLKPGKGGGILILDDPVEEQHPLKQGLKHVAISPPKVA